MSGETVNAIAKISDIQVYIRITKGDVAKYTTPEERRSKLGLKSPFTDKEWLEALYEKTAENKIAKYQQMLKELDIEVDISDMKLEVTVQ